jgi:hypothetical protein
LQYKRQQLLIKTTFICTPLSWQATWFLFFIYSAKKIRQGRVSISPE